MSDFGASEIVALIALFVGWVLSELSGNIRRSDETRRRLSRALSTCIRLNQVLITLSSTNDYFRTLSNDPVALETLRSRTLYSFNESVGHMKVEIDELVDVYREYFPLGATSASLLRDVIAQIGRHSLKTVSRESKHYAAIIDSLKGLDSLSRAMVSKMSRQLAAKIGPITYIKICFPTKMKPSEQEKAVLLASFSNVDTALREHLSDTGRE